MILSTNSLKSSIHINCKYKKEISLLFLLFIFSLHFLCNKELQIKLILKTKNRINKFARIVQKIKI